MTGCNATSINQPFFRKPNTSAATQRTLSLSGWISAMCLLISTAVASCLGWAGAGVTTENILNPCRHQAERRAVAVEGNCPVFISTTISNILAAGPQGGVGGG